MVNSIATAVIDTKIDLSGLQRGISKANIKLKALGRSSKALTSIRNKSVVAAAGVGSVGTAAKGATPAVLGLGAAFSAAIGPITIVLGAIASVAAIATLGAKKMFTAAAEVETLTNRFINLGVSAAAAAAHMEDLKNFTAKTSFQLPDVARASALLLQFTDGALGGAKSLRLIGNVADVANKQIGDVALQTGKFYAALIGGGEGASESLNVLRDMGALSAGATVQIKKMIKAEKDLVAIFKTLTDDFQSRVGASKRSSETLAGVLSTLGDAWEAMWANAGGTFEEAFKAIFGGLNFIIADINSYITKLRKLMIIAQELSRGKGLKAAIKIANTPSKKAKTDEKVGKGIELIPDAGEQAKKLAEQLLPLQERAAKSAFDRLTNLQKIANLQKQINKLFIASQFTDNLDEQVKAKTKIFDIEDQIMKLKRQEVNADEKRKESLASIGASIADEKESFRKSQAKEGGVGSSLQASGIAQFAQQNQKLLDKEKKQEAHNKKMEKFNEEKIRLQKEFNDREGRSDDVINRLFEFFTKGGIAII